jgi:hypothetical protein
MKKLFRVAWTHKCICIIIALISLLIYAISEKQRESASQAREIAACHNVILALVYDSIYKALESHYGSDDVPQIELYDADVRIRPKDGWADAYVTIEVNSFHGPHSPPYATEKMVFDWLRQDQLLSYSSFPA